MTRREAEDRQRRLKESMFTLLGDERFQNFIGLVRELRDECYRYAITNDAIKDSRLTTAALGESRAFNDILAIAENYHGQLEQQIEEEREARLPVATD